MTTYRNRTSAEVDAYIERMNAGLIAITYNDQQLTAGYIYHLISEGEYFDNNEETAQYLKGIFEVPLAGHLLWYQFYSYTQSGFALASVLFGLIRKIEQSERYKELYPRVEVEARCIYCLTTTGPFTSEEHVIPEALGNDELVLPLVMPAMPATARSPHWIATSPTSSR